jgi:hypothetical protein
VRRFQEVERDPFVVQIDLPEPRVEHEVSYKRLIRPNRLVRVSIRRHERRHLFDRLRSRPGQRPELN